MMKILIILISKHFFLILTSLEEAKQSICSRIYHFLTIIDMEGVLRELLSPINLSKARTLSIYKLLKVIVIDEDKNLIFATS